ncbi:Hypothetical protein R9X50_00771500 [Acrodontium crateriforme]|uniref:Uncharacterized protein n=1 Tax=Acrodontium crateriforme TaxID=150365 RepID=A0AAQ3MC73_9PEZI|nr:Hypothetical protein R9X50_00771500 [Acrodontium crateriforme]
MFRLQLMTRCSLHRPSTRVGYFTSMYSCIPLYIQLLWSSRFSSCSLPAVRTSSECVLCNRHLTPTYHKCPECEDGKLYDPAAQEAEKLEIHRLIASVNTSKLAERASFLRNGIASTRPPLK